MATVKDDRTDAERQTHTWLIIGTDPFLSGLDHMGGGASYAAWACKPEDSDQVREWVERRGDMLRVREAPARSYRPGGACSHVHIYVVREGHPALEA